MPTSHTKDPRALEPKASSMQTGCDRHAPHLQRQRDRENPKEECHQHKATNEEQSPSQALDDQALDGGPRETAITPPPAAGGGGHSAGDQHWGHGKGWL